MTTTVLKNAGPAARKVLNFAAPALVLGVLVVSQAHGITYPRGPLGAIERSVDRKLAIITRDVQRQAILLANAPNSRALRTNTALLQRDLNILVPLKDRQLLLLSRFAPTRHQVDLFVTAASQREAGLVFLLRRFLSATQFRPVF